MQKQISSSGCRDQDHDSKDKSTNDWGWFVEETEMISSHEEIVSNSGAVDNYYSSYDSRKQEHEKTDVINSFGNNEDAEFKEGENDKNSQNSFVSNFSASSDVQVDEEEVYDFGALLHAGNVQSKKVDYIPNIPVDIHSTLSLRQGNSEEEEKTDEIDLSISPRNEIVTTKKQQKNEVEEDKTQNKKSKEVEMFQLVMNIVPLYRLLKSKSTAGLNAFVKRIGQGLSSLKPKYALYPIVLTIVNIILIDRRNEFSLLNRVGS
uniref:Uncharacterized protein n=1 Tax=Aplanochytrium stocchinoi TaxID=215587 RepID=A0A7S3LNQ5_9STRA|mmetsp:Transcript_11933/g.14854  ORF Transcript_11933/g.14854 Transcript_11933/m.14854 type:complete len:262 (+) Transcript_11933:284-1069(+)|eukprot:CAMPEP_0204853074 /NCGR_PEP_ID=MMETSP1347-20130617/12776_1 /ASSEMBLY_ACC=CAM_ASM_000690 /TAXON_ID=215587 /ORGANISM="Aplanochytrium stocchinoi, Strain GSBS06" /LENGTH=261 /DNA_ID=CAMNT_0051997719 /DNA_START=141 /DNA_END=926 /DNA_ORIENTATION=-